jgi:transmembrane sensor
MVKKQLLRLAKQYFSGRATLQEREDFSALLDKLADKGSSPSQEDETLARDRVWKKLKRSGVSNYRSQNLSTYLRLAASFVLIFAFGYGVYHLTNPVEPAATWILKTTSASMRSTVTLTDGSVIRLNEKSSLKFPENFGPEERQVFLQGEAFFDIKPDAKRPFTVFSGENKVTVLGTSFNIHTNGKTEVTVATGKVRVQSPLHHEEVDLERGQQALIAEDGVSIREVNPAFFLGWMHRKLEFQNEPVVNVFAILERAYGVSFELSRSNKSSKCLITGTYEGERIETILKGMKHILDFEFQMESKEEPIKIFIKDCK